MKKIVVLIAAGLMSVGLYAQKNVAEIGGVRLEGTPEELTQKLQSAGFKIEKIGGNTENMLLLETESRDVREIREHFNATLANFENDPSYVAAAQNNQILDNSNVRVGLSASFYKKDSQGNIDKSRKIVFSIGEIVEGKYRLEYSYGNN